MYIMDKIEGGRQYFHFRGESTEMDNDLIIRQCTHLKVPGVLNSQCRKRVEIGLDMCWIHLLAVQHLRIKASRIPGAGLGLFAEIPNVGNYTRVFRKGNVICRYNGQNITNAERENRYGDNTGPYILQLSGNQQNLAARRFEDAALERGIGSIVNHTNTANRINAHLRKRNNRMVLIAARDILNGSEILTTYGNDYVLNEPNVRSGTSRNKRFN